MTIDEKREVKEIQKKLEELSQRQLELEKTHQQRVKSQEEQKTWYQHLFGQPTVQPDPELQSFKEEMARLEKDKDNYFKILQAAASIPPPVPEKDLTKSPFYSHTLRSWKFDYPFDQLGFYLITLTGIGTVSKALWRSWNIKRAAEMLEKGVESEMLSFHRHFSRLNNEELMKDARMMRYVVKLKAFAFSGLLVTGFTAFVQLKNQNRFI